MRKLLLVGFLFLAANIAWAETEFKIITLQHRFAQDLLPTIQPMVGEDRVSRYYYRICGTSALYRWASRAGNHAAHCGAESCRVY